MRNKKVVRVFLILLSILFLCFFLFFDGAYLIGQGYHLFSLRRGMQDIDTLLKDADLDPESKEFFALAQEIRTFAVNELGLNDTPNYTKYVPTDRSYLVDVVSAVRSDSFIRYQKKYPLIGEVFYKGYFNSRGAKRFAEKMKARGYDVIIRKVGAYSSLGLLVDPLFTYMRSYPEYRLAELIIHEQVHATLWIPGQNQFNEEIATFIGREGAAAYIGQKYGIDSPAYNDLILAQKDKEKLLSMVMDLYTEMQNTYSGTPDPHERRILKKEILQRAKQQFSDTYHSHFFTDLYIPLINTEWNHALIDLYLQYNEDLALYYRYYELNNNDLFKTVAGILSLDKTEFDPKQAILTRISS